MMSIIQLLLLLSALATVVHGACTPVNGTIDTHELQSHSPLIRLSTTPMSEITLNFTVVFPSNRAGNPVMYVHGTEEEHPPLNNRECFLQVSKLIPNKHYVPLSGNYAIARCSKPMMHKSRVVCTETVTFTYLKPRYWFVRFGYPCGEGNHPLSLTYDFCANDNKVNGCRSLTIDDTCKQHINDTGHVHFPNRFGHKDQSEALQNRRHLDVFATLSDLDEQNHCYEYISTFLCMSLYPVCSKSSAEKGNTTISSDLTSNISTAVSTAQPGRFAIPCRRMCKELFQGCQKELDIDGIIECEKYPSGREQCLYLEVKCPQLNQLIVNGSVAISASEAHNTIAHRLNDTATYSCDEGFFLDGATTLTCLPSGQWSAAIPECKPNGISLEKVAIISFAVIVISLILSVAILVYFKDRLPCLKKVEIIPLEERARKVFVSFSSENRRDVDEFIVELKENIPQCEYITYHDDFIAGDYIVEDIRQAVWEDSRAFISYVTQDFIDSNWCVHEFREALRRKERDPWFQVVIVIDEAVVTQLVRVPDDIQTYLTDNIYLCFTEVHFWERLNRGIDGQV